ncbi:hypothetical protein HanPSC8_Chr14g0595651 [Helianthus annuus]|nr:hypothetical protein HanPSC8_Chr14g0595651 [Helianthus annuus]
MTSTSSSSKSFTLCSRVLVIERKEGKGKDSDGIGVPEFFLAGEMERREGDFGGF